MSGPFIERKSAPDGEDLKLEQSVAVALREYSPLSYMVTNHPKEVGGESWEQGALWFKRYLQLGLQFIPRALTRLQLLRAHNLMLRQVLFSLKKQLRDPQMDYGERRTHMVALITRVLEVETPL